MKVDLYGRVSTTIQAREGYSIEEQEKRLRSFADANNWEVHGCYMDGGFTGANINREGIQKVIDDCKNHRVEKVIVYKLDRLSRSQKDILYLIEDVFIKNGVGFISMTESLDTSTPLGMAMIGIMSVFAQLEREQIKERLNMGKQAAVAKGNYRGGSMPIGYHQENGRYWIEPEVADIIREYINRFIAGESANKLVPQIRQTHPAFAKIAKSSFLKMLRQPVLIGKQKFRGEIVDFANMEPILDMETWDRLQDTIKNRSYRIERRGMVTGVAVCAYCGKPIIGTTQETTGKVKARAYKCEGRSTYQNGCPFKQRLAYKIDDYVIAEISKISLEKKNIRPTKYIDRTDDIKKQIADVSKKISALFDLYLDGSFDQKILKEKIDSLEKKRADLYKDIERENKRKEESISMQQIQSNLYSFMEIVDTAPPEKLSVIIKSLIHKIVVSNDTIDIFWNFE